MTPRLILVGLVALAAAGCGGGGEAGKEDADRKLGPEAQKALDELDAAAAPADPAAAVAELLSERARALEAADGRSLTATATGTQRALDRRSARRAKRLAIKRIRFVPEAVETSGDRAKVTVTMSYRVRGMSRPFVTGRRIVARKLAAGWRVTRDSPRSEPLPWEVAAFEATREPHVVLLTAPRVDAAPLRAGLAEAYRQIQRDLPARDLPRSVLVIAARDAAQTERLAGPIAKGVVALANVRVDFGSAPALRVERVLAQRMIVVDSLWSTLSPVERQSTLVHEMTHTALNADTSGRTPPWLVEGVAMYVSGDDRSEEARLRATGLGPTMNLRQLCKPDSIFRMGARDQGAAYAASSAAAEQIVARRGSKALFRLYDAFNDPAIRGRTCAATTDRAMRRTVDMSLAELEAAISGG